MLDDSLTVDPSARSNQDLAVNSRDERFPFTWEESGASSPLHASYATSPKSPVCSGQDDARRAKSASSKRRQSTVLGPCKQPEDEAGGITFEIDDLKKFGKMFGHMFKSHAVELLFIIFSYILCVALGAVHVQLVDISFFKAVGLLLAVLLSLRAKMAMGRRQKLMNDILSMMNSARNIVELTGGEASYKRERLRSMLSFCFAEIAAWAVDDDPGDGSAVEGPRLEDLSSEDRDMAFILRGKVSLHASPRPLLVYLRQMCDELFEPELERRRACLTTSGLLCRIAGDDNLTEASQDESCLSPAGFDKMDTVSVVRRYHRNIEIELHNVTNQFDHLLMYKEELHTTQFRWMISSVILLYVALYPWCVRHESTLVLGGTTMGMAFVFYGLNAMTEQLEDPVAAHEQGFDLAHIFKSMFDKIGRDEAIRTRCLQFLRSHKRKDTFINDQLHETFVEECLQDDGLQEYGLHARGNVRKHNRQNVAMVKVSMNG
jgi:hypothetical protein